MMDADGRCGRGPILEADGIRFSAGGREILHGVSLAVHAEETFALLGPSGCGKTTLLRIVAGLERPDAGRLRFADDDVTDVPAHRRGFGLMFQDFALFPHLDVAGNVGFGLRGRGLGRAARQVRVEQLLALMGLSGLGERTIETLSGGERQRVALARTLAPEPRLLMLDEPLGALDRALRERLLLELRAILTRLAIPALYVTHDQREAFALADRIAVMKDGRIVRVGTPPEIHAAPRTEFVANFLGMTNVVMGQSDGQTVATPIGRWRLAAPPGPVRLLLRSEGARLAAAGEEGVVSGRVSSRLFQGARTLLRFETSAGPLEFDVASDAAIPREGQDLAIAVPHVQVLDAEAPADEGFR